MLYKSLKSNSELVNFETAVKNGLAKDGGLYFPTKIKALDKSFIKNLPQKSNHEIAYEIIKQFVGDSISEFDLKEIIKKTLDFPFPLVEIEKNILALELFHGPTLAFKDVGARFMANCLGQFNKKNNDTTVLVATSGDTGAAVANGFLGVKGTKVIILYPSGKVSKIQEHQLTTNGQNIIALKVNGFFDDCQKIVKTAFTDKELNNKINLTSANSINVARWLPQMFYYFIAYKELTKQQKEIVFSVPSGNFGNICAGLIAMKLGLPVKHFVASTNINDTIPNYFKTKKYIAKASKQTISNAMDVGDPSNFVRILEIFENDHDNLLDKMSSFSFDDKQTIKTIYDVYNKSNYILDPHGAVGYLGIKKYLKKNPKYLGIFLETAHPVKFSNDVEKTIGCEIKIPSEISNLLEKEKKFISINNYKEFKSELIKF
ncbi:MAG: threonine synthase [Flavobacteriales bacterium]|jgi:threonine synthase|tara:strand:- start:976 stop:2268 length:1293 start_codon:yes stop_codon:yes gene_type:complete